MSVRLFGSSLYRALNLHLSSSDHQAVRSQNSLGCLSALSQHISAISTQSKAYTGLTIFQEVPFHQKSSNKFNKPKVTVYFLQPYFESSIY